tara:strand:- start:12 stop:230 length:219 start_codon:yes stop_codon:yes gene_type:complete
MNNELAALKLDCDKLMIQTKCELIEKNHYKKELTLRDEHLSIANSQISDLRLALNAANEQYQCLMLDTKREL